MVSSKIWNVAARTSFKNPSVRVHGGGRAIRKCDQLANGWPQLSEGLLDCLAILALGHTLVEPRWGFPSGLPSSNLETDLVSSSTVSRRA